MDVVGGHHVSLVGGTHINSLVRKTRRDSGALFFGFTKEDREILDGRHGDVAAVITGEEGL